MQSVLLTIDTIADGVHGQTEQMLDHAANVANPCVEQLLAQIDQLRSQVTDLALRNDQLMNAESVAEGLMHEVWAEVKILCEGRWDP